MENKKVFRRAAWLYVLANFAAFIIFFLFTGVEGVADTELGAKTYVYVIAPLMKGLDVLLPISAGFILYVAFRARTAAAALLYGAIMAIGRYVYTFLYYYLYFVYSGYSSVEACGLSGLWSILGYAIHYALILAVFFGIRLAVYRIGGDTELPELLSQCPTFCFKNPLCLASMMAAGVGFVYIFVMDVIDTVSFIIEYGTKINGAELASMLIAFAVDIVFLFIIHAVNMLIKRRLCTKLCE